MIQIYKIYFNSVYVFEVNSVFVLSFHYLKFISSKAQVSGPLKFPLGSLPAAMAHCFTIHWAEQLIGIISNLITDGNRILSNFSWNNTW